MIYSTSGKPSSGMTLTLSSRNRTHWLSIANFLEKDPLVALGLAGGWARGEGEARPRPAPEPEFITPPSNTGVNKVGDVAGVERQRPVKYSDLTPEQKAEIRELLSRPLTMANVREFINEDMSVQMAFLCGALIPTVYFSLLLDMLA